LKIKNPPQEKNHYDASTKTKCKGDKSYLFNGGIHPLVPPRLALLRRLANEKRRDLIPLILPIPYNCRLEDLILSVLPNVTLYHNPHLEPPLLIRLRFKDEKSLGFFDPLEFLNLPIEGGKRMDSIRASILSISRVLNFLLGFGDEPLSLSERGKNYGSGLKVLVR